VGEDPDQGIPHAGVVLVAQPRMEARSPRHCARSQGFPSQVVIGVADLDDPAEQRDVGAKLAYLDEACGLCLRDDRHMVEHSRLTDDLGAIMSDPALVGGARTVRDRDRFGQGNLADAVQGETEAAADVSNPDDGENTVPVSANDVDLRRFDSDCIFGGHFWEIAPRLPTVPE